MVAQGLATSQFRLGDFWNRDLFETDAYGFDAVGEIEEKVSSEYARLCSEHKENSDNLGLLCKLYWVTRYYIGDNEAELILARINNLRPNQDLKNVFTIKNEVCRIIFNYYEFPLLPVTSGLQRIHYLIANSNVVFSALELCLLGQEYDIDSHSKEKVDFDEFEATGVQHRETSSEVLDKKAIREYTKELRQIKKRINELESIGNKKEEIAKLEQKMLTIASVMLKSMNIKQESRLFDTAGEDARRAVSKTIHKAYDLLSRYSPALVGHLIKYLKIGYTLSYNMPYLNGPRWNTNPDILLDPD